MAHQRDYENIHDIEELDDRELRDLVRGHLSAHGALDIDDITVTTHEGRVTLGGRVGTEGEKRIAEHVLTDVLGIVDFTNELLIDPIRRAESPLAIDDHLADEERRAGTLLGDVPVPRSDEAVYRSDRTLDDISGTTDYEQAVADGITWNPPEGPTPEGITGADARPEDMGERH
jgi:hypothetical protein